MSELLRLSNELSDLEDNINEALRWLDYPDEIRHSLQAYKNTEGGSLYMPLALKLKYQKEIAALSDTLLRGALQDMLEEYRSLKTQLRQVMAQPEDSRVETLLVDALNTIDRS